MSAASAGADPAADTLLALALAKLEGARDGVAMHVRTPGAASRTAWTTLTWEQSAARIAGLARALQARGVQKGDRVAVLGDPDPRWIEADLAILLLGAVTVGIYPTLPPENIAWQLCHAGARVVVGASADTLARIPRAELPDLVAETWDLGTREGLDARTEPLRVLRALAADVRPEDPCAIFYTSGTTGDPKGAVVTHGAMVATVRATCEVIDLGPRPVSMVFLPLAHSLQRIVVYRALVEDAEAWVLPKVTDLLEVLPLAQPTVLATVPRMLEKIRAGAEAAARARGPRPLAVFQWAARVAREVSILTETGRPLPAFLRAERAVADRLVFTTIRTRMGGQLRQLLVGGARLDPEVARFFHGMGFAVCEGWGLTETCAPATLNRPEDARFGSVGRPLPGMELRLDADGEVLVRGPGLFAGYWNEPEASASAFTTDGWFRTGDIGVLEEGRLRIVDRKKELIVTSGGKNIPPVNLEKRLEGGPLGQAVVIGDDRAYLVALVAPDPDAAVGLSTAELHALAEERVTAMNATLPPYEQVKRVAVLPEPLTVEAGLLTPTLKLRRKPIAARYAELIESLYER